ncbi:MAG: hypothetical protein ACRC6T_15280 [Sarcina sp.]
MSNQHTKTILYFSDPTPKFDNPITNSLLEIIAFEIIKQNAPVHKDNIDKILHLLQNNL